MDLFEIMFMLVMAVLFFLFGAIYTNIQVKKERPLRCVLGRSFIAVLILFIAFSTPYALAVKSSGALLSTYPEYDVWNIIVSSSAYIFPTIAVPFFLAVWLRYRKPPVPKTA